MDGSPPGACREGPGRQEPAARCAHVAAHAQTLEFLPNLQIRELAAKVLAQSTDGNFRLADKPGVIAGVRAKRRAAHALLKTQSIGCPGGVYRISGAPPLLHLLFYKVVENNVAGNCVDGLDLPAVTEDHKIQLRIRGGDESTRAVRIYGVGARNIDWRD